MSHVTRICLCAISSAALAATCLAQGKRGRQTNPERAPERVEGPIVIVPRTIKEMSPSETSKVGQATITYYPKLNRTLVGTRLQEVYRRGEVTANVEFDFGFDGREPSKEDVRWAFLSDRDIFGSDAPLTVVADGKRYSFQVEQVFSVAGRQVGHMDFAAFERIVNSKSTRLSVGRVAFDLTESQREALRDMLKVFEKPAKP